MRADASTCVIMMAAATLRTHSCTALQSYRHILVHPKLFCAAQLVQVCSAVRLACKQASGAPELTLNLQCMAACVQQDGLKQT